MTGFAAGQVLTAAELNAAFASGVLQTYGAHTASAPVAVALPALAAFTGQFLEVADLDNNASVHNITVTPSGIETISYYGVAGSSLIMNTNSASVRLFPSTGTWRAISP